MLKVKQLFSIEGLLVIISLLALGLSVASILKKCPDTFGDILLGKSGILQEGERCDGSGELSLSCEVGHDYLCAEGLTCSNSDGHGTCIKGKEVKCSQLPPPLGPGGITS